MQKNAFKYLIGKKGSKGKEITETELCMAEYLLPTTSLTICEKQQMFAVKNRMKEIPAIFSKPNIENHEMLVITYSRNLLNLN